MFLLMLFIRYVVTGQEKKLLYSLCRKWNGVQWEVLYVQSSFLNPLAKDWGLLGSFLPQGTFKFRQAWVLTSPILKKLSNEWPSAYVKTPWESFCNKTWCMQDFGRTQRSGDQTWGGMSRNGRSQKRWQDGLMENHILFCGIWITTVGYSPS